MKYWLTTHWAPSIRDGRVEAHEGVWVQDGLREVIKPVQPGDLVFIYETGGGKREMDVDMYGGKTTIKRERGRQGIVALLEVTGAPSEILFEDRIRYANGDDTWWKYKATTRSINSKGFVPRQRVCDLIGWKSNYSLRGIGASNSGLLELSSEKFEEIQKEYLDSLPRPASVLEQLAKIPPPGHGLGGEGAVHLALKKVVAADPAGVLNEPGLRCVRIEAPFATNDRVDIVLTDRYGRFVMVEIEVACGPSEVVAPLQCIKYRAMWAYSENRPVEEVRAMLVAHSMDKSLIQRARDAGIECKIVPQSPTMKR